MDCAGSDTIGLGPLIEGKSAFSPAPVTIRQSTIVPKTEKKSTHFSVSFKSVKCAH